LIEHGLTNVGESHYLGFDTTENSTILSVTDPKMLP